MDLQETLLRLRSVKGVESSDLDSIAEYVSKLNAQVNRLKTEAIEKDKSEKKAKKTEELAKAIEKKGLDPAAFKEFYLNTSYFKDLDFGANGDLFVGDTPFDDYLNTDHPFLGRSLTPIKSFSETSQKEVPSESLSEAPQMGTSKSSVRDQNPIDTLVGDGLFAVPKI